MSFRLTTLAPGVAAALAEDHLQFAAPVLGERDQFPLDLRREVAQHRLVGGMDAQRRRGQQQARRERRDLSAGEVALALEGRERPAAARRRAGGRR